jgi:carbon-monoxide dehydrogenase large subunit
VTDRSWIGRPIPRVEDEVLLGGRARSVADLDAGDPLHLVLVRSPLPHARVIGIDRTAASRLPGVVDVLVAGDLPADAAIRNDRLASVRPTTVRALADDVVRSIGEPVAAVVATKPAIAEDAAELVRVDYAPLAAVGTLEQAEAGDALVYPSWGDNVLARVRSSSPNVDAAFAAAPHVFADRYRVPRYAPMPLEPRGCVAVPSADGLTLWSSTQLPFIVRTVLAEALGLAETDLRVIVPHVGGGFGAKMHVYGEELLVCLLAQMLERPVRWIETRSEHTVATVHAREVVHRIEIATDVQGRLLAMRVRVLADMGTGCIFFPGVSPAVASGLSMPGPYRLPDLDAEITCLVTNRTPTGAYRGFGQTEAVFAMERTLDLVAHELRIDRADLRARNLVGAVEMPYRAVTGAILDGGDYRRTLERALEMAGYEGHRHARAAAGEGAKRVGIGIACYVEGTAPSLSLSAGRWGGHEWATVRLEADGRITVVCGLPSQGQGQATTLAQIVAEELCVTPEAIRVSSNDTAAGPYALGTWGSRSMVVGGAAALLAARELRHRITQVAAHLLEAAPEDLELEDAAFRLPGGSGHACSFREIAAACYFETWRFPPEVELSLEATAVYRPEHIQQVPDERGRLNDCVTYGHATHVAVVEIDTDSGTVSVVDYVVVHDCGTIVNPAIVDGQIVGGVAQGIGAALLEEVAYDAEGRILTAGLTDYLIPTATEVPRVRVAHDESAAPWVPGGFRGVGESGIIGAPAAIAGAVEDALGPDGSRVRRLPLTPERVLALARGDGDGRTGDARGARHELRHVSSEGASR